MPPLNPISGKKLRKLLLSLGFEEARVRGSHHFFIHEPTGKTATIPIHGNETLPTGIMRAILRDIELSVEEYEKLRRFQ